MELVLESGGRFCAARTPWPDCPCDGLQSGASQPTAIANTDPKPKPGRNREAAPRQSHQQYTTHGKPAASHPGSHDSPIRQQAQGRAGCWAREPRGATESGAYQLNRGRRPERTRRRQRGGGGGRARGESPSGR